MYDDPLLLKFNPGVRGQGYEVRFVTDWPKEKLFHPAFVSEQAGSRGNVSKFYSRSGQFEIRTVGWLIALM